MAESRRHDKANGHGRVRAQQGFFAIERTCPNCHGRGEIIDDPCRSCGGTGRVTRDRTLSVNVPPGVEDGTRIRLGGEGAENLPSIAVEATLKEALAELIDKRAERIIVRNGDGDAGTVSFATLIGALGQER